ncbi:sterol desaturase family protein [Aliamphritea ceti]|uniref:sterol desaturase family protein n=1 Tax=Aliamphritea ceti TaxID=1524258 RepID=UPI0021C35835|nr:sterol desaturase family protein [Aliamphritea ceti]
MSFEDIAQTIIFMFEFWIQTSWYIAFSMSFATNVLIYITAASFIDIVTNTIIGNGSLGTHINNNPLKKGQKITEIKNGIISCLIFSLVSLLARKLFAGITPESIIQLSIEILLFTIFYETYSYFVHRLLHTKLFIKPHAVHHYSVRTTPWSAYSVHPIEALLISLSAPVFMWIFPVHLCVIFAFHILGVIFTMVIHSNLQINNRIFLSGIFNRYTRYHAAHHSIGNVNFGFVYSLLDSYFNTKLVDKKTVHERV